MLQGCGNLCNVRVANEGENQVSPKILKSDSVLTQ